MSKTGKFKIGSSKNPRRKAIKPTRKKNFLGFGGGRKVVSKEEIQELQQDAAKSHCSKGEYKQAQKVARMSPRRFAKSRSMQIEGVVQRAKKRVKKTIAEKALSLLKENPKGKKKNCAKTCSAKKGKTRRRRNMGAGGAAVLQVMLEKLLSKQKNGRRKKSERSRA